MHITCPVIRGETTKKGTWKVHNISSSSVKRRRWRRNDRKNSRDSREGHKSWDEMRGGEKPWRKGERRWWVAGLTDKISRWDKTASGKRRKRATKTHQKFLPWRWWKWSKSLCNTDLNTTPKIAISMPKKSGNGQTKREETRKWHTKWHFPSGINEQQHAQQTKW